MGCRRGFSLSSLIIVQDRANVVSLSLLLQMIQGVAGAGR
jgi:hypothetical protein